MIFEVELFVCDRNCSPLILQITHSTFQPRNFVKAKRKGKKRYYITSTE